MMCSFMFGFHIHEKHILMITIPLSLISLDSSLHAKISFITNIIANFSLLPLLPNLQETPIKFVLFLIHSLMLHLILHSELKYYQKKKRYYPNGLALNVFVKLYLIGLMFVQLFYGILQPLFFKRYQFLPLMLYSVYSAIGCVYCWYQCWNLFKVTMDIIS